MCICRHTDVNTHMVTHAANHHRFMKPSKASPSPQVCKQGRIDAVYLATVICIADCAPNSESVLFDRTKAQCLSGLEIMLL